MSRSWAGVLPLPFHLSLSLLVSVEAQAQGKAAPPAPGTDSAIVVVGPEYRASGFNRFFFGTDYRALWTAPVTVKVLDLETFGGGLTPTTVGGGFQTKSIRFKGPDGLQYSFRSVDKDPSAVLPPDLRGSVAGRIVRDQISSSHPAGALVVAPIMEAAGILHTSPHLVVLPDDPVLGEHRERFAGVVGTLEVRPLVYGGSLSFAGAAEIINTDELDQRLQASPTQRIDARTYLAARLLDILVGDWDRHRGQWNWARFGDDSMVKWVPLPEDRDQAFARFDGALLTIARTRSPQLVKFGNTYGSALGMTWNGRDLDRRFLAVVDRPVWDSIALALKSRLTDSVIDLAVAQMPPEYRALNATWLAQALKDRREKLPEVAGAFYQLLLHEVNIHTPDTEDSVTIDRGEDGAVTITIVSRGPNGEMVPYLERRFDPRETQEIRLYLQGGDDRVAVSGSDKSSITVRVVLGDGSDTVVDSVKSERIHFYGSPTTQVTEIGGVHVDRRPYTPPPKTTPTALPPRDWGSIWEYLPWFAIKPDIGVLIGGGVQRTRYGFRKFPFASQIRIRAAYATEASAFRVDFKGQFLETNSRTAAEVYALASGIETLYFFGFGNETPDTASKTFYRVNQAQYLLAPVLKLGPTPHLELRAGPVFQYSATTNTPGRFITSNPPYGSGEFGQIGIGAQVRYDTRDHPAAATRGVFLTVQGTIDPGTWDLVSTYGQVNGAVSTYFTAGRMPFKPTLALRLGGKKIWGTFPFQNAAYIGGSSTVRLNISDRYAGDASVYGNAELRIQLTKLSLLLPFQLGLFGLADVGRVFLEGTSSDVWHPAFGGGPWLYILDRTGTLTLAVTGSEGGVGVFFGAGFAY